jgi:cell shape-determining protein MreC
LSKQEQEDDSDVFVYSPRASRIIGQWFLPLLGSKEKAIESIRAIVAEAVEAESETKEANEKVAELEKRLAKRDEQLSEVRKQNRILKTACNKSIVEYSANHLSSKMIARKLGISETYIANYQKRHSEQIKALAKEKA